MVMMSINIWVKHKNGRAAALHLQAMSCNLNESLIKTFCVFPKLSICPKRLNQDNINATHDVINQNFEFWESKVFFKWDIEALMYEANF